MSSHGETLRRILDARISQIQTACPGIVRSYDRMTQTADIQPAHLAPDGSERPVLPGVPVLWPRGGDGYLVCPLAEGDSVLLVTCSEDPQLWRERGEVCQPDDQASHELQSAVAIPGLFPRRSVVAQQAGSTVLAGSDVRLGAATAGDWVLRGSSYYTALNTFLTAAGVFATAIGVAVPALVGPAATFNAACTTFSTATFNALSSSVKVA